MEGPLAPDRVTPMLAGAFGRPYLYVELCESTQALLDPGLSEGAVAVSEEQSAGRGRLGREWQAPPGQAILCSILLHPPVGRRPAELSLLGGLAVAEAVEAVTGHKTQIKWPNDVMVEDRKIAGVLAEASGKSVILGAGVNVNQTTDELPRDTSTPAGSLFALDGVSRDRAPLLCMLLLVLEQRYALWRFSGLGVLHEELRARDFLQGRRIVVGGEEGIGLGIDPDGRLEAEVSGVRRLIESGEIRYAQ